MRNLRRSNQRKYSGGFSKYHRKPRSKLPKGSIFQTVQYEEFKRAMKYNVDNFNQIQLLMVNVKDAGMLSCEIGTLYLQAVSRCPNVNQILLSDSFIEYLSENKVLCDSNLFLEYIYVLRNNNFMNSSKDLLRQIKNVNIHRPSFKLIASIITTYCTLATRDIHKENLDELRCATNYALNAKSFYDTMKKKYKYIPNTYLYNSILNMFCKLDMKSDFWDLVLDTVKEGNIKFDAFSYGSILEMCLLEKNPAKGEIWYEKFLKEGFQNDKNIPYVKELFRRIQRMSCDQKESFENWRNSWEKPKNRLSLENNDPFNELMLINDPLKKMYKTDDSILIKDLKNITQDMISRNERKEYSDQNAGKDTFKRNITM